MKRQLLIVDLEATCWQGGRHRPEEMEIIEIGALLVDPDEQARPREFQSFVRPQKHPRLSRFCRQLTGIRQADIGGAKLYPEVQADFLEWIGDPAAVRFGSWGDYDRKQFARDCTRHEILYPFADDHFNIKAYVAGRLQCSSAGLAQILGRLGLRFEGNHHRGLDDARNIWRILARVTEGDLSEIL